MRICTLLTALLFTTTVSQAQTSLTVAAGPDKAWCSSLQNVPVDTPLLGGTPTATGGTAPYTYQWSLFYTTYQGNPVSPSPGAFLSTPQAANPKLLQKPGVDSMRAIVQVTDASGRVASDTAWVYFQTIMCTTSSEPPLIKQPADTVTLRWTSGGCMSSFRPYVSYRWRPAEYLVDSTVQAARCFTPVSKTYTLYATDRIGCPVLNSLDVVVQPAGVSNASTEGSSMYFNAATRTITTHATGRAQIQLVDLNGRVVWNESISGTTNAVLPASLPSGMYLGLLRTEQGTVVARHKWVL